MLLLFLAGTVCEPLVAAAGAPVLVLTDAASETNPFGNYLAEILRSEGLMAYHQNDRSVWSSSADPGAFIGSYEALVVAEMNLSAAEQQLLRAYVQQGGLLIAARPVAGLSDLFGIQIAGTRPEKVVQYYGVDAATTIGRGITHGALQYHGEATNYTLQGASPLGYLYDGPQTPSAFPAITTNSYGNGRAVAFAFDPAKSVVLTRQGNPEWQNTEGDNIPEYRPHDMFARTDGTTYYDPTKLPIPQADELQRFFANTIVASLENPLPRMWYLPGTNKTIMVNTGDGEDNFGPQFNQILNDAASYGGKFSVYLRDFGIANTSVGQEAAWRAAGHEVGVHMYAGGAEGVGAENAMAQAYSQIVANLQNKFGHGARTSRNHSIDWTGWVDMARIESGYGTQLDTNYYHYLNTAQLNPLTSNGYFTGSGLPQRFIDSDGRILPIFQAATQWPDEWFANAGLSAQQSIDIMKRMFAAAEEQGYYSAFVDNIHPVRYNGPDITSEWAQAIWEYCETEGIPMWSAEMLLDFSRARNATRFLNVTHSENALEFDYVAGSTAGLELTLMIPARWQDMQLELIALGGEPITWTIDEIKGVEYAMFTTPLAQAHILASYAATLAGDYNDDGRVDGADYVVWRENVGTSNALPNDPISGTIGQPQYEQWRTNFGAAAAGQPLGPAVPEPSSWTLLVVGSAIWKFCSSAFICPLAHRTQKHAAT